MAKRTAVSAGGVILREIDGKLKIALAHHQRNENRWVLPKGHVEPGETIEQAALREIYEESGLDNVLLIKHLGTIVRKSTRDNGDVVNKTIHYYLAYALDNHKSPIPTDNKFTEVGWFSPKQAIALLPYEAERAFFKEHLAPLLI